MGKKPKNEEAAPLPKLRVPPADAEVQLRQLLEKGIEVKALKTRSPEELDAARSRKQEWTTLTTQWLTQLFEDESVAEDFNTWVGRVLPEYADFAMFVENFQDEMHQRLLKLHSIFQRVADTPQVGEQFARAAGQAPTEGGSEAAQEAGSEGATVIHPPRISKTSKKGEAAARKAGSQGSKVVAQAELAAVLNDGKLLAGQSPAPIPPRPVVTAVEAPAATPAAVAPAAPVAPPIVTPPAAAAPQSPAAPQATPPPARPLPSVSMAAVPVAPPVAAGPALGRGVVVAYGQTPSTAAVSRFIERLGVRVEVLQAQPADAQGKTVAERLQETGDLSFAVLLVNPGDVGAAPRLAGGRDDAPAGHAVNDDLVFELGLWVGKLGVKRVCVMYDGGVQVFTDKRGVQYVPVDAAEGWQLQLAKRMRHAGIAVDLNRAA